jgi:tetratricopeptide (TPR) repeat protein
MPSIRRALAAGLLVAAAALPATILPAAAAADPALAAGIAHLEHRWAAITYQMKGSDTQDAAYKALAVEAAALARRFPDRADPLVWGGIIVSTEAGVAGSFDALSLADDARDLFVAARKIDPRAVHGAIYTSLGTLYYKVPGFPLGFGDDDKARKLLKQGVAIDPDGLDSNYFYGSFLYGQGDYAKARTVLTKALAAPAHPDRPVWDQGRRRQVRAMLAKVERKLAQGN